MKKKIVWLVVSCLMVATLLLASCAAAEVEEEEVVTPEEEEEVVTEEEVVVTEEEVVVTEEKEMVRDSLGRLVEKPKYGGVFNLCLSSPIVGFDEAYTFCYQTHTMRLTNEELITGDWASGPVGTNDTGWLRIEFLPHLEAGQVAESWEILDDRTVRFKIRKGIHFALNPGSEASRLVGGRELNAHDVAYSLKRHFLTPGCYMQLTHTAKEEEGWDAWAEDDWTVIHQWNPELARVILEYSDYCSIIAQEVIEKYGDMKDWRNSVGTGPFMLTDYVDMSSGTFVRNPNYWQKHPLYPEDTMPYLDGVKMLIIPDLSTRIAAMRTGKIDYLSASWEDAEDLMTTNPELEYMRYITGGSGLTMRMDNPDLPWWDKKVRHALALAVNNQEIADDYYAGNAEILTYPVLPDPEYRAMYTPLEELPESSRELYGYNPEKAKQLLAEAGYPDGFAAKIVCYDTGVDVLSITKAYWADIGVDLQLDVREYAVYQGIQSRSKQEEMIYGIPSVAGLASKFSNFYGPGNLNISRINTKYVDPVCQETIEALDALGSEYYTNLEKFAAILKPAFQYIIEECWSIPLPGSYTYKFWPPWVKDYHGESYPGYLNSYKWPSYIWIDQDLKYEMTGRR